MKIVCNDKRGFGARMRGARLWPRIMRALFSAREWKGDYPALISTPSSTLLHGFSSVSFVIIVRERVDFQGGASPLKTYELTHNDGNN